MRVIPTGRRDSQNTHEHPEKEVVPYRSEITAEEEAVKNQVEGGRMRD